MTVQNAQNIQQFKIQKLFKVSDYCCVSVCNNYGGAVRAPQGTNFTLCLFPDELGRLCGKNFANTNEQANVAAINAQFAIIYANYMAERLTVMSNSETRLTYWGYDRSTQRFFIDSYLFDASTGTNIPVKVVAFDRGNDKNGTPLTLTAEVGFLSALIMPIINHVPNQSGDKLETLRSQTFRREVDQVFQEEPMQPNDVVHFMLELFELHKNHAQHFNYDKGWIDDPYVFILVTKNGISTPASFVQK